MEFETWLLNDYHETDFALWALKNASSNQWHFKFWASFDQVGNFGRLIDHANVLLTERSCFEMINEMMFRLELKGVDLETVAKFIAANQSSTTIVPLTHPVFNYANEIVRGSGVSLISFKVSPILFVIFVLTLM